MNRILRVNMKGGNVSEKEIEEKQKWIAGRALTSKIISEEVEPTCDVLGKNNKLVFATGLFAGSTVSSANRLSIGGKSPLTGTIKESNAGGTLAFKMGKLGIRCIVIEDVPPEGENFLLYISKEKTELIPANKYWGIDTQELACELRKKYGEKVGMALIGSAGGNLSLSSGIAVTDLQGRPSRFAGRGGLGALMGSKGLKAVIIDDQGAESLSIKDVESFTEIQKEITKEITSNEQVAKTFTKLGTSGLVKLINSMGALPTQNFSKGSFDEAESISGEAMYERILERGGAGNPSHSCMPGCIIRCSNVYPDKDGEEIVAPLEYETIGLMGSNCGISDLDTIAHLNKKCNDLGLDTIDTGGAIAIAMEAGVIDFGDGKGALELLDEVYEQTWLGKIIASGGRRTGEVLGVRRIPTCKSQIIPAYDPRAIKGLGVTYATSTMGADHTAGQTLRAPVEHTRAEGQVEASRNAQITNAIYDITGTCFFLGAGINKKLEWLSDLATAVFGEECKLEDLYAIAGETLQREKDFNYNAGFSDANNQLPEFFYFERNPDTDTVFDVNQEEMKMIF
ncbi:MAG: aldehyde ferredoxin oxidoreductase [Tindallia sp. MSAO_Bac2]|nr:MAG: aldehyde ferredoxin oxidoreductase [Tindallia sp. MSAO_Bac2]